MAKSSQLPMDDASRAARAEKLGFHPATFYHGTAGAFTEFDLARGGRVSGSRAGGQGVSITPTAAVAEEFATAAARKSSQPPNVMELRARLGKVGGVMLTGAEKNLEVAATLAESFRGGYDTVVLKNYTTPEGKTGNTVLVVKDPAQLRSAKAAFDPAKVGSRNLMAGFAGLGVVGAAAVAFDATRSQALAAGDVDANAKAVRNALISGGTIAAVGYGVAKGIGIAARAAPRLAPVILPGAGIALAALAVHQAMRGYRRHGISGAADVVTGGAASYFTRTYTKGPKAGTTETVRRSTAGK